MLLLEPIRNRRKELERDIPAVYEILKKGSDEAREVAAQTLSEVKSAMRINYFDDAELIRMQSEKYEGKGLCLFLPMFAAVPGKCPPLPK